MTTILPTSTEALDAWSRALQQDQARSERARKFFEPGLPAPEVIEDDDAVAELFSRCFGIQDESDAAEPANLEVHPGDDAVASADRFARGCIDLIETPFKQLSNAMKDDHDYAWAWHCNIAVPLMDMTDMSHAHANAVAARLMRHLFLVDTATNPRYLGLFPVRAAGVKAAPAGLLSVADSKSSLRIGDDA